MTHMLKNEKPEILQLEQKDVTAKGLASLQKQPMIINITQYNCKLKSFSTVVG